MAYCVIGERNLPILAEKVASIGSRRSSNWVRLRLGENVTNCLQGSTSLWQRQDRIDPVMVELNIIPWYSIGKKSGALAVRKIARVCRFPKYLTRVSIAESWTR